MSPQPWTPPAADKQAWAPPAADAQAAMPKERSFSEAVANAGEKFWDWTGKPVAMALGLSGGTDAERGAKAREAQKQIVGGIMNEPARVRQELTNALDAFVAGNPRATMHHVLTAVPVIGEGINQAAQEFDKGDTSSGVGHMAAILAPAGAKELPAVAAGARTVGSAAKEVLGSLVPERTPTPEGSPVNPLLHRVARGIAGKVMPGGGLAYDVARDFIEKKAAEVAPEPMTPGRALAEQSKQDWSKMAPQDRAMMETVAKAQANAAAQPPRPPMGPPQATTPVEAPATPVAPSLSIADQIRAEIAARNGPAPVEEAPAAPPQVIGAHQVTPLQSGRPMPLRPPLAQMTRPQIIEATGLPQDATPAQIAQAVATEQAPQSAPTTTPTTPVPDAVPAPPARSLAQTEAAMAQKKPAPVDIGEARSIYDQNGEVKSSQQRGVEKTAANRTAKAQRFAQALHDSGITAEDAAQIEAGHLSDTQIGQGMPPRWGNIAQHLGEDAPSEFTMPQIVAELRKLEKPAPAASKRAPGGGMGAMKNYTVKGTK